MLSLVADDRMRAILDQAKGLTEIRDAQGQVIGFYAPIAYRDAPSYVNAAAHIDPAKLREENLANPKNDYSAPSKLDPAEIQRRKADGTAGRTTQEVFEYLLTLANDEASKADLLQHLAAIKERDQCGAP